MQRLALSRLSSAAGALRSLQERKAYNQWLAMVEEGNVEMRRIRNGRGARIHSSRGPHSRGPYFPPPRPSAFSLPFRYRFVSVRASPRLLPEPSLFAHSQTRILIWHPRPRPKRTLENG